ncbi:hybrid sensor histidine kinase/response regulator [Leptolyngbya sp. NIES-2104]|uniref:hybrid sensor histidine kinase/response regulator n=1 Tax=Leptolyngbya sp. NIES-2104 TaxID=1552121 RepID=UPI00073F5BC5|nr:response regulator [Leptolyngbya sp. NIES-2104]
MTAQSLILIVDDNATNAQVLVEVLARYNTLVAKSGEEALSQLETVSPDLILLDVVMPGMDGFEICDRIQSNPKTQDIPIIFMSALSNVEDIAKGLYLGAVDYITKPFQQTEVIARVQIHLKLRQQTRQLKNLNDQLEQQVAERTEQLSRSLNDLQAIQLQLIHQEKMSTLGQLVSGIGHEINNPLNSISGNLAHADQYVQDLISHLHLYHRYYPDPVAEIVQDAEEIDLPFLTQDLTQLLATMKVATDRIAHISRSLRTFSRSDHENTIELHIQDGLDSTLLLLQHRIKPNSHRPAIQIIRDYAHLPPISCYPGQLNQVFMNLLANAIDAIDESNRGKPYAEIVTNPNQIHVVTELKSAAIAIRIRDNGIGMTEAVQQEMFKPSFTTKPVGKGTGLGLAIAYQIIVERHRGSLTCNSAPGQGTEFMIELPL